jgi:hypothetical protein
LMPFGVVWEPSEDARRGELGEELWGTSERVVRGVLGEGEL